MTPETTDTPQKADCPSASCSPCLVCGREWPDDSEQVKAMVTRGKCIVCIVEAEERIEMNPYEFSVANAIGDSTESRPKIMNTKENSQRESVDSTALFAVIDEDAFEQILETARKLYLKSQRGCRGQQVTIQDSHYYWIMVATREFLSANAELRGPLWERHSEPTK